MPTLLGDAVAVDYDDAVGVTDRGQPVRDHQGRAAARQLLQRLLDRPFCLRIESGGRFIEYEYRWVLQEHAGYGRRCFCPPDSFTPRSPMTVSRPSGRSASTSSSRARLAASSISSSAALRLP